MSKIARMMQQATAGAGGAGLDLDNVFSTFLFTGAGSGTSTIANGIDLSGEGGLVWIKSRTGTSGEPHFLVDTERGGSSVLQSNSTAAANNFIGNPSFLSNGFSGTSNINDAQDYVSWTFRKAPKFFDIVTYTGNTVGNSAQTISHGLGSTVGMIIVKRYSTADNWAVWHRYNANAVGFLNLTDQFYTANASSFISSVSSTSFTVGESLNTNGASFVAYVFAHNDSGDGEFGPDGDQDIIKCGSYNGNGSASGPSINLGFEPQFLMIKRASGTNGWNVFDTMRGWTNNAGYVDNTIAWNTSDAEGTGFYWHNPTSTGFDISASNDNVNANGDTYIYMAIRKGSLFTPTDATKVFNIGTYGANRDNSSTSTYYAGFPVDMAIKKVPVTSGANNYVSTRMLGTTDLRTNSSAAERTGETEETFDSNTHWNKAVGTNTNSQSWMWKRAPSYFDVVAYTGNNNYYTSQNVNHNLGVVPEMIWIKNRDRDASWAVYNKTIGAQKKLDLDGNSGASANDSAYFNNTTPTSSVFTVGNSNRVNQANESHVAYLFATVAGVSKVGSYSGTGSDQNIDCGFSSGARFVLIKRTDVSEGWKVHDSVRGIVAGNDPFIELNNNNAQNSSFDLLDPYSGGFAVNNFYGWNGSGGSYIFYAIA